MILSLIYRAGAVCAAGRVLAVIGTKDAVEIGNMFLEGMGTIKELLCCHGEELGLIRDSISVEEGFVALLGEAAQPQEFIGTHDHPFGELVAVSYEWGTVGSTVEHVEAATSLPVLLLQKDLHGRMEFSPLNVVEQAVVGQVHTHDGLPLGEKRTLSHLVAVPVAEPVEHGLLSFWLVYHAHAKIPLLHRQTFIFKEMQQLKIYERSPLNEINRRLVLIYLFGCILHHGIKAF